MVRGVEELKDKVREFVHHMKQPFSVNDVAGEFSISWATARAILLELALEGEVSVMKTTKSYVFIPKGGDRNEGNKA